MTEREWEMLRNFIVAMGMTYEEAMEKLTAGIAKPEPVACETQLTLAFPTPDEFNGA